MKSGIYQVLNVLNGKRYIGSSKYLDTRLYSHLRDLRTKTHPNVCLQRAWNKYGEEAFKFEILELIEDEANLVVREQYWMDKYQSYKLEQGYNMRVKADTNRGIKRTAENRKNMSLSRLGKAHPVRSCVVKKVNWTEFKRCIERGYSSGFLAARFQIDRWTVFEHCKKRYPKLLATLYKNGTKSLSQKTRFVPPECSHAAPS